ncbi:MAG TPA: hypothetical protein VNH17_16935 [Streptosporangiaceae bacterium]|nr:hypothetical protein [Streptosporangiaceae bacterium]
MTIELAAANLNQSQRDQLASTSLDGGGSWPIPNIKFLRKAIMSFGRARPDDREKVVAHIAARAKALGALHLDWVANFLKAHGAGSDAPAKPPAAKY